MSAARVGWAEPRKRAPRRRAHEGKNAERGMRAESIAGT
jgi:hypothetical protein